MPYFISWSAFERASRDAKGGQTPPNPFIKRFCALFQGRDNCNDFSIGIELEGADDAPYADAQYAALTAVTDALLGHYPGLSPTRIVGHCDIAPGRKTDPGPAFDWARYRASLRETGDN